MKKILALAIAMTISTSLLANTASTPKQLQVPFINQAINSEDYEGLSASYNMANNPQQKVVCTLSNVYKSWISYSDNGAEKESGTYGGSQTIIITDTDQTKHITETLDQLHADTAGKLLIADLDQANARKGFATCLYLPYNSADKK